MALDSYSALKTSVADWLNRADLTAAVPDFITMAEAQISRRLVMDTPPREMMGRSDATLDGEFTALPSDFLGIRAIYLGTDTNPLTFLEPEKIVERKLLYPGQAGKPQNFSIVGSELQLWPWTGDETYSAEMTYWKRVPALSDAAPTNWLLVKHPDAYLYGALLQSAPYLKADSRLGVWGQAFETVLSDIVAASRIGRTAPHLALGVVAGGFTP